jgi:multidrug efflux pump subunit AcrB
VFVHDIGTVNDSSDLLTGYALVNGRRTVYIPVTKRSDASTLDVVDRVRQAIPRMQSLIPADIKIEFAFDQSVYGTHALRGLLLEGTLGALLTGLVVWLFLRDLRSAAIVVVTIPFALLGALIGLWLTGQSVNIMTLGGLALAIGILVDEATVAIENIHTHLAAGESKAAAVLRAGGETIGPRLLAMLSILAVFVPSFFMIGVARSLFVPLSLAVGLAMLASYVLSNTLVPVLAAGLLRDHPPHASHTVLDRVHATHERVLTRAFPLRWLVLAVYLLVTLGGATLLVRYLGTDLFPAVDTGQFQLRLRAPTGTRVERTAEITLKAFNVTDAEAGQGNVTTSLAFVGTVPSTYPDQQHLPLVQRIARSAADRGVEAWHAPAGGRPAGATPTTAQRGVARRHGLFRGGRRRQPDHELWRADPNRSHRHWSESQRGSRIRRRRDGRDAQGRRPARPAVRAVVRLSDGRHSDRSRARRAVGRDHRSDRPIARDRDVVEPLRHAELLARPRQRHRVSIAGRDSSSPDCGRCRTVANIPAMASGAARPLVGDVAQVGFGTTVGEYERYNQQRMVTITANTSGSDLGGAARQVRQAVARAGDPPRGVAVTVRGQVAPMDDTLAGLRTGVGVAIVVIFLLMTANFQSLRLAVVVLSTVPAVLLGVAASLIVTGTTLNVKSFVGAIMAIGVSVANAILVVTFAERDRREGAQSHEAALRGVRSRMRPVLMTSLAMIAA